MLAKFYSSIRSTGRHRTTVKEKSIRLYARARSRFLNNGSGSVFFVAQR